MIPLHSAHVAAARSSLFLLVLVYLGFISLGLPDGTLGVAWPAIVPDLRVAIGLAGTITLIVTVLSGISGFASGSIIGRLGTGPVVVASGTLTGVALLLFAHAPHLLWLLAAAVPLGLGAGAVDAGLNGYVARHYSGRHMNWLHACWGIGATAGPLLMSRALEDGTWREGYIQLGAAQLTLAAVLFLTLSRWRENPSPIGSRENLGGESTPTLRAHSFAAWLSPALFALYAAVELTVGLWAGTILVNSRGLAPERAALITAAYYAAITAGRFGVGFVVDRWGNRRLVTAGIVIALSGAVLFATTSSAVWALLALGLLGLGLAPVYPGLMHEVPRRFAPDAAQIVIGRQSGAAYLGAAVLPAAAGALAAYSLESIPWSIFAGIAVLLFGVRRLDRIT
jgi:MFS family permease